MKKSMFLIFLFVLPLFGQKKYTWDNSELIKYFTRNIQNIQSVNGKTWLIVPTEMTCSEKQYTIIDKYPVHYKKVGKENIEIEIPKIKGIIFNFVTKEIKGVNQKGDDGVFGKPSKIKEKVKQLYTSQTQTAGSPK
jgi:hypothetical protein